MSTCNNRFPAIWARLFWLASTRARILISLLHCHIDTIMEARIPPHDSVDMAPLLSNGTLCCIARFTANHVCQDNRQCVSQPVKLTLSYIFEFAGDADRIDLIKLSAA